MPAAARLAFQNSPSGATGAGAVAAAAAVVHEAAGRGWGRSLSLFMTGRDPDKVFFSNPAQYRRGKNRYL
jgi:hypothetical protein